MGPEELEENITHMDASLYKAAAEGNIEEFNNMQRLQLESLTPNHDSVLHVNLATQENAAWPFNIFFSIIKFYPLIYGCFSPSVLNLITRIRGEKRSDFIEQIISKCPSLLRKTNAKGQTPLHLAARYGHSAIVKLLINSLKKLGMDQGGNAVRDMLRIGDRESNTALHEAARCGNVEVLEALLEFDPHFPNSANEKQETPLYIAARRRGCGRLLTLLLGESESTPHGGPHGRTALHAAAMAGDAEAIGVILKRKRYLTKERDENGHTPLHYAAHLGSRVSVVEKLLKWDVSAAYMGDKRGMTPLLMAARQGDVGTVSKIISLCPDCCDKVDNKGLNLLHYLAFRGSFTLFGRSLFKLGGIEIAYGSVRNLMELKGDFGMTPQEVYNALIYEKHHHKEKQIKELLEEIENNQVAEEPVRHFHLRNVSTESLENTRNAHLVVAALIATFTFAAAVTVPGGRNRSTKMATEEPEENITHMDAWLYKAAAEGNIEVFNNNQRLQLESLKTPNHDNVLHVNLANQEDAAWLFNRFLSIITFFPVQYVSWYQCLSIFITRIRGEKRADFIEQILSKCPSLLLQTNAKGQTPLHVAARYGHSAIVKLLIKSCAKARAGELELGMDQVRAVREMLRITDQESNTALHEAARCGNVEVLKALLKFEDPDFPYSANKKLETPLYIAARRRGPRRRGSGPLLTLLLDKLKSTGHGGPHGRTALHAAAMAGDAEAVRVILEKKGNLTKERDEDGHTPLHYAAHFGYRLSVVKELLKRDVSAAYIGDKKRGMTPLLMAARQGNVGTVLKIISLCPDCCEKVDNKGLNLLHYLAFRGSSCLLERFLFKLGGIEIAYGSVRNLMLLEGDFGMTPQEVHNALQYEKHHHKQQIKELLEEIENDQVADEPVRHFPLQNVSTESLEKTRNAHLVVAALIATVAFAAAITVPGGLQSDKGSEQGTPFFIHEAAFKAFVVTNAMAFILSVSALTIHFGVMDNILSRFSFWRRTVLF
ncbi:hypothetical protein J1N35_042396 [Gossypium stocksii]|uniref:PGG domain-containing protein n=1 Tax=Gossypium stocksii TaxID=47602 RepID=A0A9D3UHR9_9ROSI|nr:hypothetical protein J1N35_042396 [Gossypium stocksii]